jgi:hypothetical protein
MKTSYLNQPWLAGLAGIAAAAALAMVAMTYFNLQQKTHAQEAFAATFERLEVDQQLSAALRQLHEGKVERAAERLDQLLCGHILLTDSELSCADGQTRNYTAQAFQRIAQLRPKRAERSSTGLVWRGSTDQAVAEKILSVALACAPSGHAR